MSEADPDEEASDDRRAHDRRAPLRGTTPIADPTHLWTVIA